MTGIDKLIEDLILRNEIMMPCSVDDVMRIEKKFNLSLPKEYKKFLFAMGRGTNSFLKGSSCFYPELLELKSGAENTLNENNFAALPNDAFVFFMHQGYQFAFFKSSEGDDPPVYYYNEVTTKNTFESFKPHLSDFFYIY